MQSILKFHARTNTTTESQASIKYILIIYLIALKNVFKKNIKQHNKKKVIIMVLKKMVINVGTTQLWLNLSEQLFVSDRSWLHPHTHSLYGQSWRRKSCDLLLLLRWRNEGQNKWRIKVQEAEETEHWKKRKQKPDKERVKKKNMEKTKKWMLK